MESCLRWWGRLLYDVNWQNDRSQLLGGMWFLSFTDNTTMFRNLHKCQKHHKNWTIQIDTPMTLNKVSHQNFLFFLNITGKCFLPTSSLDLKATPCVGGVCVNPFHVVLNRITSVWWEDTVCKFLAINIPLWHFGNMKAETLHFLEIAPLVQIYINIYRWHCNKTFQWLPISKNSIPMIRKQGYFWKIWLINCDRGGFMRLGTRTLDLFLQINVRFLRTGRIIENGITLVKIMGYILWGEN